MHFLDLPPLRDLTLSLDLSVLPTVVGFSDPLFLAFLIRSSASLRLFTYIHTYGERGATNVTRIPHRTTVCFISVLTDFATSLLTALNRKTDWSFFTRLRRLEVVDSCPHIDVPVVDALRSRYEIELETEPPHLESLRLISPQTQDGERVMWWDIGEIDWDSLWDFGMQGLDIHVGPETQNCLWDW
jgi:hypothetical protein